MDMYIIEEYDPRITLDYTFIYEDGVNVTNKQCLGRFKEVFNKIDTNIDILEYNDPVVFKITHSIKKIKTK